MLTGAPPSSREPIGTAGHPPVAVGSGGDPFDNDGSFYLALERYGYDISDGKKAVEAFQRRWRPEKIDGEIDGQIRAILFRLLLDRDQGRTR